MNPGIFFCIAKDMMTKQRILILVLAALGGLILAGIAAMLTKPPSGAASSTDSKALIAVTGDAFGGPFTLTDHNGKAVTEKDFAGKYRMIYFGFTFCPAICPTELSKMTAALNKMGDAGKQITPIFITVDPERDTPEKMKSYVSMFHPTLVGLTGTPEQIKAVTREYKIYAAKVEDPQLSEYTMDHTSWIMLMAPDDRLLRIFKADDSADDIAAITTRWIEQNSRN